MTLEQSLCSVANEVFPLVADGSLFLNWPEQGYFFFLGYGDDFGNTDLCRMLILAGQIFHVILIGRIRENDCKLANKYFPRGNDLLGAVANDVKPLLQLMTIINSDFSLVPYPGRYTLKTLLSVLLEGL